MEPVPTCFDMNLFRPLGRRDEVSALRADGFFLGVDERRSAATLEEGLVARARNARFRKGKAESRPGVMICPWMLGNGLTPWQELYGAAVFSDPNQPAEWMVIAADGAVWKTRPGQTASRVPLPAALSLTADSFTQFVQCFNVLVLLRGPKFDPLVCTNLDVGFTAVPAHVLSGMRDMPRASFGLHHLNRLWLIEGKDIVGVSDALSYTEFTAVENVFRINAGSADRLLNLQPLGRKTVIALKEASVWALTGLTVDLAEAQLEEVTTKYGLAAARGVARSGTNLYWVSEEGHVASLALTDQNEAQDTELRLSEPLAQTFARVNPLHVGGAVAEVWAGKLYVALPLDEARVLSRRPVGYHGDALIRDYELASGARYFWDGAGEYLSVGGQVFTGPTYFTAAFPCFTAADVGAGGGHGVISQVLEGVNTGVAVYDFANQAWCGVDEAPEVVNVKQWLKARYQGRSRLFAIGTDGVLRLWENGWEDEVFDDAGAIVAQGVPFELVTRGYLGEDGDRVKGLALTVSLRSWAPRYAVSVVQSGVGAEQGYREGEMPVAANYQVHGKDPWVESNVNDDHGAPGREDYAVRAGEPGLELGSGVAVDAHQAGVERVVIEDQGQWLQGKIACDQGRMEVLAAGVESQGAERRTGWRAG